MATSLLTALRTTATEGSERIASTRSQRMRVVVIGNGPVGWKLCELLSDQSESRRPSITVFGEEAAPAYDRVHLSSFFEHRDSEKLALASRAWYADRGIALRTGDPIIEVDTRIRRVRTKSGQIAFYDKLVLATGSRPFVPPIPGVEEAGVHVYRTVPDLEGIAEDIDRLKASGSAKAAVLGGGLLGLEAAKVLSEGGLQTHVVEMAAVLMPKQLDSEAAALLQNEIEELGVVVHTLTRTQEIRRTLDGRLELVLDGEENCIVDTVVISAGIRPRDELASASGIATHDRGGIIVSDRLETSEVDVFAIGECAVHDETVYGLVAPGYHMAGVLAERLTSRSPIKPTFRGHDNATRLKLLGVDVVTLGDFLRADSATRVVTHSGARTYRKLILKGSRLVGATLVGECDELPRLSEAVESKRRIGARSLHRFREEGRLWKPSDATHVSEWPANATVCSCMAVSRGTLTKACESGCETVEDLIAQTKASSVCGSCRPLLAELVGSPETAGGVAGWRALGWVSVGTGGLIVAAAAIGGWQYATSVQSPRYAWDQLLLNDFYKQVTGFTLVGLSLVAACLSLRKRWGKFSFGVYGLWRVFHSTIGFLCLAGLIAHTGFCFGANLNFALMISFLGTIAFGVVTGVVTSFESRSGRPSPQWIKTLRPVLTWGHVLMTWPLPVLVLFHAMAFYIAAD